MKILVVGSGGREHALVWKLAQSKRVKRIYAAPGSAGIAQLAELLPVGADRPAEIVAAAREKQVDLVVVGPELPLTLGLADLLGREKIPVFGPNKEASRLEGSKSFAKQLMREEGVPTAQYETFEDYERAADFLETQAYPVVIKADGLAAGKGVLICRNRAEAVEALGDIFQKKVFGEAGRRVVIEEFLEGQEVSYQVIAAGTSFLPLRPAQDHKQVFDHDEGPNTGGMGAYAPCSLVTPELEREIADTIIVPTLKGLAKRGIDYRGVLYAGLMITRQGPKVLEFNVRFGDPETQPLMVLLETDLADLLGRAATGKLAAPVEWRPESAVCVVLVAQGYPGEVQKGDPITGLEEVARLPNSVVFHAGTRREANRWLTNGGRVLGVTGWGKDLSEARAHAYDACGKIHWTGRHYRRDIGAKGISG